MDPEILSSARKHGISDDDMLHAYRLPIRIFPDEGDWELAIHIGPATNGITLLEVGVAYDADGKPLIVHAMPARKTYLDRLR
jgi:hypothetical protein